MTRSAWWVGLAFVCGLGCGAPPEKLVPVSGRVTLDGEPLAGAYVSFQPQGGPDNSVPGPASAGKTDADGRYSLAPVQPVKGSGVGAVVGNHRVTIRKGANEAAAPGDESGQYKEMLPERYNAKSDLVFPVPAGGTDQANFKLTSEP